MALTPIVGAPLAYQVLGTSPHLQRFGVHHRGVTIKNIAVANHTSPAVVNTPTAFGTGVLAEGSIMQKGNDGNWYIYGGTLPGAVAQQFLSLAAGGVPTLALLIDPIDTTFNGAGNPVTTGAYFSGDFILSFLQFAIGGTYNTALEGFLRLNDIFIEGTSQVTPGTYPGTYGVTIPPESAPV